METQLDDVRARLPVLKIIGTEKRLIKRVVNAGATSFDEHDVTWVSDKNSDLLNRISAGTVIVSANAAESHFNHNCTYLIVDNPRLFFLNMVKAFFIEDTEPPFISDKSVIDPSVKLGKGVTIRAGAVLERDCHIDDDSTIDSNTVVKKGTVIGKRVKIGANNTIGGVGFGYEKDETGQFQVLPHLGNVVIEDDVEIGNNTTIDRAVMGSTIIRRNVKIDNLVHIAHGVEIGENTLIIANAMIAGSCVIGKNAWVAPSASVLNKLSVGDDAVVGIGAVVLKNVSAGETVVGNPAKDITTLRKQPK